MNAFSLWISANRPLPSWPAGQLVQLPNDRYGFRLASPTWAQILDALMQMDGTAFNELALEAPQGTKLLVGGGNDGRFVVLCFPRGDQVPSLTLCNPAPVDEAATLTVVVQTPDDYSARFVVDRATVIDVLQHVFTTGNIPAHCIWELE
jgi:hypothetical protein